MKIHPADVREDDGQVTVAYRFESASRPELNDELWFRVPATWREWISPGPEPAVASLAMLAMALGEDIEVAQPIRSLTHYGIVQCVDFFHLWHPQKLQRIRIAAPACMQATGAGGSAVVSCFSAGVDSFHTVYDHLGEAAPNPDFALTHLFFAHGFDIPVDDPSYEEVAAECEALAAGWNLGLIRLATNARVFLDPHVPWVTTHGMAIAACALLLSAGTRTFMIPSTNRHSQLFLPCGSNPVTDPVLGTETMRIVHYGCHRSRIEKIRDIAHRTEAQQFLRVCWQNVEGVRNCGACAKCLKVMMPLALEGVLEKFTGFPPLPAWDQIDSACFAPFDLSKYDPEQSYVEELRALALERGEPEIEAALRRAERRAATSSPVWKARLRRLLNR